MRGDSGAAHLTVDDVAAYLDRQLAGPERARVQAHLGDCAECRREVVTVARLARSLRARRRWAVALPLAAAAVLLVAIVPWSRAPVADRPVLREPAVTTTVAPTLRAPVGAVAVMPPLSWTSVPHADRYRVTVFDSAGAVVWETQTGDTSIAVPASVLFRPRTAYFWKVAARTGWDRWVASDLISFTLALPSRVP
jgi:anti-sigma factor RsiW